ncbi:hypothetical protein DFH28DRAFT_934837 [Melampsora americana]|nr:hypothetical protein DFH28DRAFT_934837 [Melampsora americana]
MGAPDFDIRDDMESSAIGARSIDEEVVDDIAPNHNKTKYVKEEIYEVSSTISVMVIMFACNCCVNGLQLHNALTFIATGVSSRIFKLLQTLGISTSQRTVEQALESL